MLGSLREHRDRLADAIAARLLAEQPATIIAAVPGDAELLRALAPRLNAAGRDALLAAPSADGTANSCIP